MLELAQLRTFVAVAEHLSFTRAAERLGLSQQSVSKAVRALEQELGVVLLERTTREVRVTPAGAALVDASRDLLARADAAVAQVRSVHAGLSGRIRVGYTPAIGDSDRVAVSDALRDGQPALRVSLHEVRPAQLRSMLRDGELDIALTRARGLDDPAIRSAPLRDATTIVCAPAGHPLAHATTLRELDGVRLLVPSAPGTPYTDLVIERFAAAGARVEPVEAHVTGGTAMLGELATTGAVVVVAAGTPLPPGVVALAVTDAPQLPLFVLWATGRPSPAARRVIERLPQPS